jgi:hypothetical protein
MTTLANPPQRSDSGPVGIGLSCSVAGGVAQLAERYVRNVEAVGSNPITSTKKAQVNGLKVGPPKGCHPEKRGRVSLSVFTGTFVAVGSVDCGRSVDEVHRG